MRERKFGFDMTIHGEALELSKCYEIIARLDQAARSIEDSCQFAFQIREMVASKAEVSPLNRILIPEIKLRGKG